MAAGEGARALPEIGQQTDGFGDGFRAMVRKGGRNHGAPPGRLRADAPSVAAPLV
jgi:hypothetical protein